MDLFSFIKDISGQDLSIDRNREVVKFCQDRKLIPEEVFCKICSSPMYLGESNSKLDQFIWRCSGRVALEKRKARKCRQTESIRTNTIFAKSHLPISKILLIIYFWVDNLEIQKISKYINVSKKTVGQWCLAFREVLYEYFSINPKPIGGPGSIIEIDESKFGKRKYNRGHTVEGQWVFGGIDKGTGDVFLVPVEKRDRETLVPLIKTWIRPNSTIISDCWKAYDIIGQEGYEHLTVNHSLHFKDPATGAHTNTIESTWRHVKHNLPEYHRQNKFMAGYLAKYMFLKKCKIQEADEFGSFCKIIVETFNPNESFFDFIEEPNSDDSD